MTNREMERRYLEMKHTYHTILMANTNLVDDLKDLKDKVNEIEEMLDNKINEYKFYDEYDKADTVELIRCYILAILGSDK